MTEQSASIEWGAWAFLAGVAFVSFNAVAFAFWLVVKMEGRKQ